MSIGRNIDDRFWGLEADVFKTNYRKETVIAEFVDPSNQISNEIQVELDFSTTITSFYWQIYCETAVSNNVLFCAAYPESAGRSSGTKKIICR